ncbi:MAG TPA: Gfo/Idh/MocA family oxidoreductase [Bryobacteraceae bacterium]|nr:Gfo/Idh/MocA family oxidoreductase [Bryobacteraceae bacterium]
MAENKDTSMTRRDVVKLAGAATVAAAAAEISAPAIQKVRAANDQVQFGMIGTGSRGSYLLGHLAKIDRGHCVALCDINPTALDHGAQTIGTNPKKFKDYRELLALPEVEAVYIAVPLYVHFMVTKDSLLAGKNTFCEKSLVFKPEEVHELRQLAADHTKQILQVGLQRRYSKFYQTVKEMVDKGVLGEVTHVHAQWHRNPGWTMKPGGKDNPLNWRLFRQFSGGMTAELASHQVDVADWMFGATPDFVVGVGSLDWRKDGRDINDNIQLIYKYPGGRKMTYTAISTNDFLPYFNGTRTEMGELIMGTEGAVEITVGDDTHPVIAQWYPEPVKQKMTPASAADGKDHFVAGATMVSAVAGKALPVLLPKDQITGNEGFIDRELKFARRWLYTKGVIVPEEDRNPVDTELETFLQNCRDGGRPRADVSVGLNDSTAVILSNLCMDEERRVNFSEIDKLGTGAPAKAAGKKA